MRNDLAEAITKERALELLKGKWHPLPGREMVSIEEAAGRVLAEDQYALCSIPVVRASMMDGIAVKSESFLDGVPDTSGWKPGEDFVRADTGDDFDDRFDAVIAIEDVTFQENGGIRLSERVRVSRGFNVKPRGAEVREGSLILKKGAVLKAQDLAALALGGLEEIPVVKKPVVAFLPTGSELVKAGRQLKRGQNYDTNSILVRQMLLDMGAEPLMHPIVPDDLRQITQAFDTLLPQADIVLINAGTSKGEEDYSHRLLKERGDLLFHGVAAGPGRPMSIAMFGEKPVMNISGPAFAAFYSMDWAVRDMICQFLGCRPPVREKITATLTERLQLPPFFSLMVSFHVERAEDGTWLATPLILRGPKTAGTCEALTADAVYVAGLGESALEAGTQICLELLKNRSEL